MTFTQSFVKSVTWFKNSEGRGNTHTATYSLYCELIIPYDIRNSLPLTAMSHLSLFCIKLTTAYCHYTEPISTSQFVQETPFHRNESFASSLLQANNCMLSVHRTYIRQSYELAISYYARLTRVEPIRVRMHLDRTADSSITQNRSHISFQCNNHQFVPCAPQPNATLRVGEGGPF